MARLLVDCVKKELNDQQIRPSTSTTTSAVENQFWSTKSLIDPETDDGVTPLLIACAESNYALIELFVEAGANVCATDRFANTTIINSTQQWRNNKKFTLPSAKASPNIFKVGLYSIRTPKTLKKS